MCDRRSSAAAVMRSRANNDVGVEEASERHLLGREGVQEQQTLRKIRRIYFLLRKTNTPTQHIHMRRSRIEASTRNGSSVYAMVFTCPLFDTNAPVKGPHSSFTQCCEKVLFEFDVSVCIRKQRQADS